MRVGMTIFCQNAGDWDRYEAEERGENVPAEPAMNDRQVFLEDVNLAITADGLGFDTAWVVEHHFTPYTMITNPLQLLTYLAAKTKNVDLGTMIVVLPWHNPVRVAEDVNMLDSLLDGRRLILGVGRGLGRREFNGLNVDQNEARGLFDESVTILRKLLKDGEIADFEGEHYSFKHLRLRPRPERDLSDTMYCSAGSPETLEIIGKIGVKPMVIPNTDLETTLQGIHKYIEVREAHGHGPTDTRLALWTYCAETEEEAQTAVEKYMPQYADTALRHYELLSDHLKTTKGYEAYGERGDLMREHRSAFADGFIGGHPWGTPEMIIERVKELATAFGTSELTFVFRYGEMPIEEAEKSMRLFAEKVLPEIAKLNPEPLSSKTVVAQA